MRRLAMTALALFSALVAVVAVGLWVSTAVVGVRFDYTRIDRSADPVWTAAEFSVGSIPHDLTIGLTRVRHDRRHSFVPLESITPAGLTWRRSDPTPAEVKDVRRLLPAAAHAPFANSGYGDGSVTTVAVPFWMVVAAAAVLPAWRAWEWGRRLRRATTACRRCGYDLRGSPGRCPECGAAPVADEIRGGTGGGAAGL